MAKKDKGTQAQTEDTSLQQDQANAADAASTSTVTAGAETKVSKSIVPIKYAGKYKGGGSDDLAKFINEQSKDGEAFSFDKFFQLVAANGIAEEHIAPYRTAVGAKQRGSEGRARMTLRNRLATIARKNKSLTGLDGQAYSVDVPALPPRTPKAGADTADTSGEAAAA